MSAATAAAAVLPASDIDGRVSALDWGALAASLDARGYAHVQDLLSGDECRRLAKLYDDERHFRKRVVMARHGFGRGEYKYFAYPLPQLVASLRSALYTRLAPLANRWSEQLRSSVRFPDRHSEFLARCHAAGQTQPTPLLLHYDADDYNCLHQDLYGEHVFPLQATLLLSQPSKDFSGGEFLLTEQRPRMQSRAEVVPLARGDAVIFAVRHRPVPGARSTYRVSIRHGVSRVVSGRRRALGIILHDAA
jgi:hypothetical protein